MAKLLVVLLGCGLAACARPSPPAATPVEAHSEATTVVTPHLPPADPCFETIDLRALLSRHAAVFGSEAQLETLLPRRVTATVEVQGSVGTQVGVQDRERLLVTTRLGGLTMQTGLDGANGWALGPSGVVQQLRRGEDVDVRLALWLANRRYLSALDAANTRVRCERAGGAARVIVTTLLADFGSPELTFDLASAQLLTVKHTSGDSSLTTQEFTAWVPAVEGVRWPTAWVTTREEPVRARDARMETRIACDASCFARPADVFVPRWPKAGLVSAPLVESKGVPGVKVRVGTHEVTARLASSAHLSIMDGSSAFAAAFKPTLEAEATYAPGRPVQVGVLESVSLGNLVMPRFPVASVDAQRIEPGADRPALVLGSSLFDALAVRIDYKASRVVVAARADALHSEKAQAIPLYTWSGKRVAEIFIGAEPHFLEVDTADPDGLTPREDPIQLKVTGKLGNGALSGCAAVVFDVRERTLWLEPPCEGVLSAASANGR